MSFAFATIRQMADLVRNRVVAASELVTDTLDRIEASNSRLRAFVTVAREHALEEAARCDAEIAKGHWRGPLHGIPFGAKDLLASGEIPAEVGMAIFKGRQTDHVATVIARMRTAGAIMVGKLTQTEGSAGGYHPSMSPPLNPWDEDVWPGASSSGAGVALAAGLCPAALASDTGGSIRAPSAACGVTGLLPGRGRVSRFGAFPMAPTMDVVGPMARSAEDCAILLAAIAGHDPADPATLDCPVPDYPGELERPINALRIGWDEAALADVDPEVRRALDHAAAVLVDAGARMSAVRYPETRAALEGWVSLAGAENALHHRDLYERHGETYGTSLRDLIELGRNVSPYELASAAEAHLDLFGAMTNLLESVDALLVPVSSGLTPAASVFRERLDWRSAYPAGGRFVGAFSVTGHPTITFPAGISRSGLPIGVQLAGRRFGEGVLLRLAHRFQRATDWHCRRPMTIDANSSPNRAATS